MIKNLDENRTKAKNFVESKNFDLFIMSLICLDAVVFGLMTSEYFEASIGNVLFVLDRLCMAIFNSKWNVFDFTVIAVSSFSFASYFIVLRTFRLFRLLKYIDRFSKLKRILTVLDALMPNFLAAFLVFAMVTYVFAIIGVSLFGGVFIEFSTLGASLFALLQTFTLDGWASELARPVMSVFPHSWLFFTSYLLVSFLLLISFLMSVIDEIVRRDLLKEVSPDCLTPKLAKPAKKTKKSIKQK